MNAKNFVIITSIFSPTEAIKKFSTFDGFQLVVVGDAKTPLSWSSPNTIFLPFHEQRQLEYKIVQHLPINHYARKNIGYIYARKSGAALIAETDDDNVPYDHWKFPSFDGYFNVVLDRTDFVNIYSYYTKMKIWPRGFPLSRIADINTRIDSSDVQSNYVKIGVWQGLADLEPDVDAIFRLTDNSICSFEPNGNIVLVPGAITPFNSQNTCFRREVFPLLYIPSTVTMRSCDILRGYVAQPIMWIYDYHLGVTQASVFQKRNEHNYLKDFEDEIPIYLHAEKIVNAVSSHLSSSYSLTENLYVAYETLATLKIVETKELRILETWINDIV